MWFNAVGFDKSRPDLGARFSPGERYLNPGDLEIEVRVNNDPLNRDPASRDYVVREDCRVEIRSPNGQLLEVVTGAERLRVINALSVTLLHAESLAGPTMAARLANAVSRVTGCTR